MDLFEHTFSDDLQRVLGPQGRRREHIVEMFVAARDAAGHTGRPYLAAEARMAVALAWELLDAIPTEHHDPSDLRTWLTDQAVPDNEGFTSEPWDVCEDSPLTPEFLAALHRRISRFKRIRTAGDGGFSDSVEELIGQYGMNLFLRAGELTLGTGLPGFSGLFHENDLGVLDGSRLAVLELKHRMRSGVSKDDLMIFNQKTLDFQLALIRAGTRGAVLRVFITNDSRLTDRMRAFCMQWGIVLVDPVLTPIPVLLAAMRDLDGTALAAQSAGFERHFVSADRLARNLRPLDRILVSSNLSSWRRLIDAGEMPSGGALDALVEDHKALSAYVGSLYQESVANG